jgi:hypothetical protein
MAAPLRRPPDRRQGAVRPSRCAGPRRPRDPGLFLRGGNPPVRHPARVRSRPPRGGDVWKIRGALGGGGAPPLVGSTGDDRRTRRDGPLSRRKVDGRSLSAPSALRLLVTM